MDSIGALCGVLVFGAIIIASIFWHHSRSEEILAQWAVRGGFTLLQSEYRTFFTGPYFWRKSKGQTVYYVSVQDRDGHLRHGYVRCGGLFLGLWSDCADVTWDD